MRGAPKLKKQVAEGNDGSDDDCPFANEGGHTHTINHLINTYNMDINYRAWNGYNALLEAAEGGHTHTINHLINTYNMDINSKSISGKNALDLAKHRGRADTVAYLKSLGLKESK